MSVWFAFFSLLFGLPLLFCGPYYKHNHPLSCVSTATLPNFGFGSLVLDCGPNLPFMRVST